MEVKYISLSYIFEYGRLLGIDRNAKLYGDYNE